jgi:crossover junction endodeoxyribonuclease RuvC
VRVLGIDPGSLITGYACLEAAVAARSGRGSLGTGSDGEFRIHEAGVIRLRAPSAADRPASLASRLRELDADLTELLARLAPTSLAVEKLYAHYKHPTTAIVMGHARGIVLLGAARAGIKVIELGATEVKKSLTGNGHASKPQMQRAVQAQLNLDAPPKPPDVADAIAIALCALRRGLAKPIR